MNLVCPACGTTNRVPDDRLADQPVCGRCAAELAPAAPVALTDATLPAYITASGQPVLVDYWAEWCGPCKMMAPHFAQASAQLPGVRFAKLETDDNPRAAGAAMIRSIPTLVLYQGGQEVARQSGALATGDLLRWVSSQLASKS